MDNKTVTKTLISQENNEIDQLTGMLYRVLSERKESRARVVQLLTMLRERVVAHFQDESWGGFLDQQTRNDPELIAKRQSLCEDHPGLSADFDKVIDLATGGTIQSEWWNELGLKFHELGVRLQQHKTRERELLESLNRAAKP